MSKYTKRNKMNMFIYWRLKIAFWYNQAVFSHFYGRSSEMTITDSLEYLYEIWLVSKLILVDTSNHRFSLYLRTLFSLRSPCFVLTQKNLIKVPFSYLYILSLEKISPEKTKCISFTIITKAIDLFCFQMKGTKYPSHKM